MDYKELIVQLRAHERNCGYDGHFILCKCLSAIETLMVELDALIKDVVRCDTCLHVKECYFNELRRIDCAQSNRGHWQWRGPQKGDN